MAPRLLPRIASALLALVLAASCGAAAEWCVMCGREECTNLAFTIHLAGGGTVETCCPRCALRYLERESPEVDALALSARPPSLPRKTRNLRTWKRRR